MGELGLTVIRNGNGGLLTVGSATTKIILENDEEVGFN